MECLSPTETKRDILPRVGHSRSPLKSVTGFSRSVQPTHIHPLTSVSVSSERSLTKDENTGRLLFAFSWWCSGKEELLEDAGAEKGEASYCFHPC